MYVREKEKKKEEKDKAEEVAEKTGEVVGKGGGAFIVSRGESSVFHKEDELQEKSEISPKVYSSHQLILYPK